MKLSKMVMPVYRQSRRRVKGFVQRRANRDCVLSINTPFFAKEIGWLYDKDQVWVESVFEDYKKCEAAWGYLSGLNSLSGSTDGYAKSIDVAEGFAVWALVAAQKPRIVVELGVQYGISSRLWKEALKFYVPEHKLYLCDLEDKRQFIDDSESIFLKGDAFINLPELFETEKVDILHNDAHPYSLIDWSVATGVQKNIPIFTFHDVNGTPPRNCFSKKGLYLTKEQKIANDVNWASFGHWERHVMVDQFDSRLSDECLIENDGFKIVIFESLFGFGVALNKNAVAIES